MIVHKHRFPSVEAANAFVCGVNWTQEILGEENIGGSRWNPLEVQDILVGEMFGVPVATVVVIEDDGRDDSTDNDHDHMEHV
jgi:hypothetical protein